MKTFRFESSLWLPRPISEVFVFFSDAFNLEKITPSLVQFHVVTPPPIQMRTGAEIDYRLKIRGIPIGWRSRITRWEPPHAFVDEQVRGPYRKWIHEHRFREEEGGTRCEDFVEYATWGGSLMNKLFVGGDIRRIFAYRLEQLSRLFPAPVVQSREEQSAKQT